MAETYLNGKITLTSLAAPTAGDMAKVRELSDDDRKALAQEALERGRNSPISDATVDDVWNDALAEARTITDKPVYAL